RHFLSRCPQGNLAPDLQALLAFRIRTPDNDIIDAFGLQLRDLPEQIADNLHGQVIRPVGTESALARFAYGRTVPLYNVCIHVFFLFISVRIRSISKSSLE